ncbi:hypothetical protein, partial [Escherichia coli]|uniref:hypothetical protein n=1 Tax=Escherichia coli TaxID=562 RepID=UPI001BDC709A
SRLTCCRDDGRSNRHSSSGNGSDEHGSMKRHEKKKRKRKKKAEKKIGSGPIDIIHDFIVAIRGDHFIRKQKEDE